MLFELKIRSLPNEIGERTLNKLCLCFEMKRYLQAFPHNSYPNWGDWQFDWNTPEQELYSVLQCERQKEENEQSGQFHARAKSILT